MDFIRKLARSSPVQTSQQPSSLGLMTLRRLFREICFSANPLSIPQQEEKLYAILPLFYKVFGNSPSQDMREQFGDVLQFSTQVSRLMVTEIRRRASNKSTEKASTDIVYFLIPHSSESASRGWLLLNVLLLLAGGGQSIVDCMTTMHLPSTLVKCLYLFFDLPSEEEHDSLSISSGVKPKHSSASHSNMVKSSVPYHLQSDLSLPERKLLLQKVFVQTLVRLCGYISPAEELSHKDDLALLFSAVTSWCVPHNTHWRVAALEVLITISRHGLSHNVVQYIRGKHCIKTCINNLWRASVSPGENAATNVLDVDLADQLLGILRFISNTADVTQLLLDDFRQCQGYVFIGEFLLRLEELAGQSKSHYDALLNVVGASQKLTTCGFNELPVEKTIHTTVQSDFKVPTPLGRGDSVRNVHAFQVLETVFVRSKTPLLCRAVLDAMFAVYCRDPANYFILYNQNTLSALSERLSLKSAEVLSQFFAIFEYVALTLRFVPSKELISIGLLLKTDSTVECGIACLTSLRKILCSNAQTYRDVFREVGLLEMLVNCLHRYASQLKADVIKVDNDSNVSTHKLNDDDHAFGILAMDILVEMLNTSPTNAGIFRETGGARCAFNTITYNECRHSALSLVEALILQPVVVGNDDDMGTLLGVLSTLSMKDIQLKIDILKCLCKVISKSPDASAMFCLAGGFINLISLIVGLEGCFQIPPSSFWCEHMRLVYELLQVIFRVLSVALRLPANKYYFEAEVRYESLCSALKGLGCFCEKTFVQERSGPADERGRTSSILSVGLNEIVVPIGIDEEPTAYSRILCVFRLLHLLATDSFKDDVMNKIEQLQQRSSSRFSTSSDHSPVHAHEPATPYIIHPQYINLMVELLPCISADGLTKAELDALLVYLLTELHSMLITERNEQILCENGLLSNLLLSFDEELVDENHLLNPSCQQIVERLARQSVSPKALRNFLRMGKPLHCNNLLVSNGVVPLSRIKSLVSIATPRNVGMMTEASSAYRHPPAFIEFDMSVQGSCCLFAPNLFPQTSASPSAVSGGNLPVLPGTGTDDRIFPPAHCLSVASWVYVEQFCNKRLHPIRVLTITRQMAGNPQVLTCLSIHISGKHRKLIISTSAKHIASLGPGDLEDSKEVASFNAEHLLTEGDWHHIHITLQRATVLKHSTVTAHVNGNLLGISKLRYLHTYSGATSQQSLHQSVAIHAWLGTPTPCAARSSLVWRMASLLVLDEAPLSGLNCAAIQTKLGPEYVGSYQNIPLPDGSVGPLLVEENIVFLLQPCREKKMMWTELKKLCPKLDQKQLARELNMRSMNSATPISLFPNSSLHFPGCARSIGSISLGITYRDAPRRFVPQAIGHVLQDVGGIAVGLDLVAMATNVEGLYAAVKFLVCIVKSDTRAAQEMEKAKGYQALGMHLKEKRSLLNTHILHLALSLAGTVDAGRDAASISTLSAFEDLLCDLEIWHNAPGDLHKSLFDHFYELLSESSDNVTNQEVISGLGMVQRCVHFMYSDTSLSYKTICSILKVLQALLARKTQKIDLISVGQYVVSLIPSSNVSERDVTLSSPEHDFADERQNVTSLDEGHVSKRNIHLRNMMLNLFTECLQISHDIGVRFSEEMESCLGFDWLLVFMQENLHSSTVTTSLHLLITTFLCAFSSPSTSSFSSPASSTVQGATSSGLHVLDRFRIGENFGGWLFGTESLKDRKEDSLLGFSVGGTSDITLPYHHTVHKEAVSVPGFLALQYLLSLHANVAPVLGLLIQLSTGTYESSVVFEKIEWVSVQNYLKSRCVASSNEDSFKTLSSELYQVLCATMRQLLHQDWRKQESSSWVHVYPSVIIQTFDAACEKDQSKYLTPFLFMQPELITSLIVALIPPTELISLTSKREHTTTQLSIKNLFPQISFNECRTCTHPSKGLLLSLIGKLIWSGISNPKCKSINAFLDVLFEFTTERCSANQIKECISDVLVHLMKCRSEMLPEDLKSFHVANNITHFASRIVDKVWQNMFTKDTREVFAFLANLITLCHKKPSTHALDSLYRSLSRLILYQLCRKHSTISEQMVVLDTLHALTTNRTIVFGPKCSDPVFLACLCHCLFMISGDGDGSEFGLDVEQSKSTWHVSSHSEQQAADSTDKEVPLGQPSTPQEKGLVLLKNASARVWSELMTSKKAILVELFKVDFHDLGSEQANLDSARIQVKEAASKSWINYLATEKKSATGGVKDSTQQQIMKRMSSAVLGGKKPRKEILSKLAKNISMQDNNVWTLNHISVVRSLVRLQYNNNKEDQRHLTEFASKEWTQSAAELRRERGVWGPEEPETLTKWTLDSTEGPCRMRKRMMLDDTFYERYPHRRRAHTDSLKSKHKKPISQDSWEYYRRKNCLSPYYDPDARQQHAKDEELVEESASAIDSKERASDSEENQLSLSSDVAADEGAVLLNICSKCRSNQEQSTLDVAAAVVSRSECDEVQVCDMCGLIIEHSGPTEPKMQADKQELAENNVTVQEEGDAEKLEQASADANVPPEQSEPPLNEQTDTNSESKLPISDSVASIADPGNSEPEKPGNQTIVKLLEKGDKIRNMFRAARIQGLDVYEGLLLFGRDHYYIIDGFTMLKSREIRDIASLPGEHEPIIPSASRSAHDHDVASGDPSANRMCSKFAYDDIREVHKRRYLLQNIALEIFHKDGRNYLMVCPQGTRAKVHSKFLSFATDLSDGGKDSISGQRSGLNVEQGPTLLSNIIGERTVTSRWERGELSNFQYLMHLNTLAGRSYNDLMQYPVFPWVIADYTSPALDLTDPATFRDFSKPMGAQSDSRLEQYKKRYKDWEELGAIETPPYHYGTHYSSAMIVASYLVRMEPFTQHFLRLQGGHFDLADRMFHSIKDSWISASQKNMADIKELIPEFFYLPEFLLNTNRFELGQKQNGVVLDDVVLPTWAKGDPHEFIRAHREALECDYVSSHLHEWIDLIFGYKQQGETALESHNVFHHLFYEGEVDIYSIKDPLKRNATIGFINNFGQIPKQLFKKPHPQKKGKWLKGSESGSGTDDKVFYRNLENLKQSATPVKELGGPVGLIAASDRGVLVTEHGKLLIPPHNSRYLSWKTDDMSIRIGYYESERALQVFENLSCGEILCASMATETLLVTGDQNTVVRVWLIPAAKDRNKSMTLVKALYGHTKEVTSVCACASYGIIVSGSDDGSCILWDLNHLAFIRQLYHERAHAISHICVNERTGNIVTCAGTNICVWSINGQLISYASALSSNVHHQRITSLATSCLNEWDADAVLATGHADGYVRFWGLEHVQVPKDSDLADDSYANDKKTDEMGIHTVKNPLNQNHAGVAKEDTLSMTSLGSLRELPWSDVSNVEVTTEANNSNVTSSKSTSVDPEKRLLSPGFKWKQQLVLKGKIEIPRTSNKAGNSGCPQVTSIGMSKDHQKLFVGDDCGRTFAWSCA